MTAKILLPFLAGVHITGEMMTEDMELVREYAAQQSEPAFATLVSRHINLIYSAALRQVGVVLRGVPQARRSWSLGLTSLERL